MIKHEYLSVRMDNKTVVGNG